MTASSIEQPADAPAHHVGLHEQAVELARAVGAGDHRREADGRARRTSPRATNPCSEVLDGNIDHLRVREELLAVRLAVQ